MMLRETIVTSPLWTKVNHFEEFQRNQQFISNKKEFGKFQLTSIQRTKRKYSRVKHKVSRKTATRSTLRIKKSIQL